MAEVRATHPDLELTIVGEGYEREHLEALIDDLDASDWVSMPGRLSDDALVDLYRRAWVLASASVAEGWGMTITEAAACGTPAVVTDIAGHRDAVQPGSPGCSPPTWLRSRATSHACSMIRRHASAAERSRALAAPASSPGRPPRPARSPRSPARRLDSDAPGAPS